MKLELKNIGGLVGTHEYDLQPGVNRITGPSASGKSSIIRGIECLVIDDNDLFRRTLNNDNEIGHVKFGDYERNLQRVDAKTVKASIDDKTFYEKKSEWGYAGDIVFFTPESNVVAEIEHGYFDVRRYIERISIVEDIKPVIFRKEQQLDGKKKELEQCIDNLTRAQELEYDVEMLEGEIEELQEEEADLGKTVEKETGNKDLMIISSDIVSKKQDVREGEARLRRREGEVIRYTDKYEIIKGKYDRLDAIIRKFEVDYPDPESQRNVLNGEMRIHEDKKAQLRSEKDQVDNIRNLVESTYELGVSPFDNKPIAIEVLDERRKELRIKSADLASKMKYEGEQIKHTKAEINDINNSIAKQPSLRCECDRSRAEMNAAKKELNQRQHLTDDIDAEITGLEDELKVLRKEYNEISNTLKSESKDELKDVQAKIDIFENNVKNKTREIDKLTVSIPYYIIGESLGDYANRKNSDLEKLRNDIVSFREQFEKQMFGPVDMFNTSIQDICTNIGFKSFNELEIVKTMKWGELDSLDIIIQHKDGTDRSIDTLSKTEQLMLGLVFQIAAKDHYMPDFPFFVIDDIINEYQEIYEDVLKYLSDKTEYVIISQNVPYSEQKEVVIKHSIA